MSWILQKVFNRLLLGVWIISLFPTSVGAAPLSKSAEPTHFKAQIASAPGFEPAQCMFEIPAGVAAVRNVDCGYVTVPEQWANPDGPTIRLAIAIIRSNAADKPSDPLFMAQGGPGGSTIDAYAQILISSEDFVPDRDIVLFDQRGTLYSIPNLYCNEIDQLIANTIEKNLTDAEERRLSLESLKACHQRLADQEQIPLSAFDSRENASDIEAIRTALGYEMINFYGVSYGTLLGLHLMDLYPNHLRSVILDAVVPRQDNFILQSAKTMNDSFTKLFEACQANDYCNQAYPDLEVTFFKIVDQLNQNPAQIRLVDAETGAVYPNAVIDGNAFMNGLFQMLYAGSIIPALPRMIYDAKDGNFKFFGRIYALLLFDRSMSLGMYYSVICAEKADFEASDQDMTNVRAEIIQLMKSEPQDLLDACKFWDVQILPDQANRAVFSDIPTLLLSGAFDPITPSINAQQVAETLDRSYLFTFPAGGHGQAFEGPCGNGIIQSFLDDPLTPPDAACLQDQNAPDFYTSANTINFPVALELLNLDPAAGLQFLILVFALLFLLTAVPIIPALWVIIFLRRRKAKERSIFEFNPDQDGHNVVTLPTQTDQSTSFLSVFAGWLAFFSGPLLVIFLTALSYIIFDMALANDNRLFYGVRASAQPLFVLPIIFLLLFLIMLLSTIIAWIKRYWSTWTRVYYSLLTVSAALCVIILGLWGVYSAMF